MSQRRHEAARRLDARRAEEEEARRKEAEARAKARASRSTAVARAEAVAADMRHRARLLQEARDVEAQAKRERIAAVAARKDAEALERERRVRADTYRRIRREERRRELEQRRRDNEQADKLRQYETRKFFAAPSASRTARSFFSLADTTVRHDDLEASVSRPQHSSPSPPSWRRSTPRRQDNRLASCQLEQIPLSAPRHTQSQPTGQMRNPA